MLTIRSPFLQFTDLNGNPLEGGKIYIGVAGKNPETNPATVYWDSAGTQPAAQPIRCSMGVPVYAGGPAQLFIGGDFSMTVRDNADRLIYYVATVSMSDLLSQLAASNGASLIGYKIGYANAVVRTVEDRLRERISLKDWGAKCDGTTDDTVAVQTAIADIGSSAVTLHVPGPTKINTATLTFGFNTELQFAQGGKFIGTSGTELIQVQRQIVAGPRQIFQNCTPRATTGQIVAPEWFGAKCDGSTDDQPAFVKAYSYLQNTGGTIQMLAGTYAFNAQLQIGVGKVHLKGAGNNITYVKALGATTSAIGAYGSSGTPLANLCFTDFSIISSVGGTGNVGLDLSYTAFCIVERMQIQDFIVGLQMLRATNSQITKVGATYTGGTNGFVGFNILGGGTTGGNASSIMRDCYSSGMPGLTGQIGFRMTGTYMADFQFDTCETAVTNYGYFLDYSSAPLYNEDVIIRNPIVDRFSLQGILVNALPSNGSLTIAGGWTNPNTTGAETDAIYLANCTGLLRISDHQFCADTNYANATGVYATGSTGFIIGGCTFKDQKYGVKTSSSGYCQIANSLFKNASGRTATTMISMTGDARGVVNGCTFDGYATQAVAIDATSSGSMIVNCNANVTNITTRFQNLAGSGITANNTGV